MGLTGKLSDSLPGIGAPSLQVLLLSLFTVPYVQLKLVENELFFGTFLKA